ncbi:MAG: nuclear transport factor 2 family protein [Steroidobacteraceae bacterium]
MNKLMVAIMLACGCVGLASASPPAAPSIGAAAGDGLKQVEQIKQIEQQMGDAMVAGDVDKLSRIFADDWVTIGQSGKVYTKEGVLADLKSGKDKLVSFQIESMDVKVFGDIAAAHGGVTEKRFEDGKDRSGEFVWMDLLEKRGDTWVVVRSAGARVKRENMTSAMRPFFQARVLTAPVSIGQRDSALGE